MDAHLGNTRREVYGRTQGVDLKATFERTEEALGIHSWKINLGFKLRLSTRQQGQAARSPISDHLVVAGRMFRVEQVIIGHRGNEGLCGIATFSVCCREAKSSWK